MTWGEVCFAAKEGDGSAGEHIEICRYDCGILLQSRRSVDRFRRLDTHHGAASGHDATRTTGTRSGFGDKAARLHACRACLLRKPQKAASTVAVARSGCACDRGSCVNRSEPADNVALAASDRLVLARCRPRLGLRCSWGRVDVAFHGLLHAKRVRGPHRSCRHSRTADRLERRNSRWFAGAHVRGEPGGSRGLGNPSVRSRPRRRLRTKRALRGATVFDAALLPQDVRDHSAVQPYFRLLPHIPIDQRNAGDIDSSRNASAYRAGHYADGEISLQL